MMCLSCSGQESNSMKIKYFQTWGSYKIPKVPQIEIESDSLKNFKTYYKAFYINNLIVKFEQYVDGEINGYDEYEYWKDSKKLKKHIIVNHLGERKTHHYDKGGKRVED